MIHDHSAIRTDTVRFEPIGSAESALIAGIVKGSHGDQLVPWNHQPETGVDRVPQDGAKGVVGKGQHLAGIQCTGVDGIDLAFHEGDPIRVRVTV